MGVLRDFSASVLFVKWFFYLKKETQEEHIISSKYKQETWPY